MLEPTRPTLPPQWDASVAVCIAGSGFAGLSAAIEAAQAGSAVLLVEKRDFFGGNSWISGGSLAAVDIEAQQRHGIRDSTALMLQDMMRAGRQRNDPALARLVCAQSYAALQWLRQDLGVIFMDRIEQFGGHSVPRCFTASEVQGRHIINPQLARARQLGVDLRLNTRLTGLCQNADGSIAGVEIQTGQAELRHIRVQQAVVLASGGFSGEIGESGQESAVLRTSLVDSSGEILHLARQLGAQLIDMEHVQMLPCASPDEAGRGVAPVFASYTVFPYGVMLDPATGQRFVNEWTDRKTRADAMSALGQPAIGITDQQGLENAGSMIREHMDDRVIRCFDDAASLAAAYHMPAAAVETSLAEYSRMVAQKQDTAFGKAIPAQAKPLAPPYYALRLWPKVHSTMGGLRINANAQVLNTAGQAIPRLFAAGEATGGVHGVSRLGGCAITECLVFGRIAGQNAALLDKQP